MICGCSSRKCSSPRRMIQSPGDLLQMDVTRQAQHTKYNSRGRSGMDLGPLSGRLKSRISATSSCGCYCNPSCRRRTESPTMVARPTRYAHYAVQHQKHTFTWWPNAPTQRWHRNRLPPVSTSSCRHNDTEPCIAGGTCCYRRAPRIGSTTCR